MARDKSPLFRDPAEWARDWGWVPRRRAVNLATKIDDVASAIEGALSDEGGEMWAAELRKISRTLAPREVPAKRKLRLAAMREP